VAERRVAVHPAAEAEAAEAYDQYAAENPKAAERFRDLLRVAMARISERAETYPRHSGEIRRYLLPRYPYGVLYEVIDDETVFVTAVMHLKRRPGYWKDRT
jgi:plasmid stabilization system protein ParE